jgi:hypothetical protein
MTVLRRDKDLPRLEGRKDAIVKPRLNAGSVIADVELRDTVRHPHGDGDAARGTIVMFKCVADPIFQHHAQWRAMGAQNRHLPPRSQPPARPARSGSRAANPLRMSKLASQPVSRIAYDRSAARRSASFAGCVAGGMRHSQTGRAGSVRNGWPAPLRRSIRQHG